MDRFLEMRTFVQVVDAGSFIGAAEPLEMSKAAVSRHVGELEARLGVRLLNRTTRKLSLTEEGELFYLRCKELLGGVEAAESEITSRSGEAIGLLRVSAPVSFGNLHLGDVWAAFKARHPKVTFDVTLSDRVVDIVEEGFDLAIRIGRLADSSLVARKLSPMQRYIVASPAYLAGRGTPKVPADLRHHDCLCYSNADTIDEWRFCEADGRAMSVEVKGRVRANNGDLLRVAALKGLGFVDLPNFLVAGDIDSGALVPVLQDFIRQDGAVYAVYPHARYLPPKIRVFIDFLAERWGGADWPDIVP